MRDDFCIFILTHGRPDRVLTLKTLEKCNYKGRVYLVVDNEDDTIEQYFQKYGLDQVLVFDKKAMADKVDEGNNFDERQTITHARNYCFEAAKKIGVRYFLQLDDDFHELNYKFVESSGIVMPKDIDLLIDKIIEFYEQSGCLSVALAQTGDFIGGIDNGKGAYRFNKRKCMNSFFCSTDRPFQFVGAMNEDVNTYTTLASRGRLFLTIPVLAINQRDSQSQKGGITEMYLRYGTYCKAFTKGMKQRRAVRVSIMNSKYPRIHHLIDWNATAPKIISENHQKPR